MNITQEQNRIGNFTSSQIYRLMGSLAVSKTYKEEKHIEHLTQASIKTDVSSRSKSWGTVMELYVNEHLLPIGFEVWNKGTIKHPTLPFAGTPDIMSENTIGDIKCFEPKKFGQIALVMRHNNLDLFKKEFPAEYWQLVGNAILADKPKGLLLCFLPKQERLEEIRNWVASLEIEQPYRYRFIYESEDYELPHQGDNSFFNEVESFEFDIPIEDKDLLFDKVIEAIYVIDK